MHWLEPAPSRSGREYNVHSHQIATGHPFAATYEEFRAVQKTFRNFVDWLKNIRSERLERIKAISEAGLIRGVPNPPNQLYQAGDDYGGDGKTTGNTQQMSNFSFDGANDRSMEGTSSMPPPSNPPSEGPQGRRRRSRTSSNMSSRNNQRSSNLADEEGPTSKRRA